MSYQESPRFVGTTLVYLVAALYCIFGCSTILSIWLQHSRDDESATHHCSYSTHWIYIGKASIILQAHLINTPLNSAFYTVHYFLIDYGYVLESPHMKQVPIIYDFSKNKKNITMCHLKTASLLLKNVILHPKE